MTSNHSHRAKEPQMYLSICAIGILLVLFAAFAHGQQVHQLSYNNSNWADQNLFGATADSNSGIAAFPTTPNDQSHVYYLSSSDHVRQLFFNGTSWGDEDLTSETGGPVAIASSAITGFSFQNFQYVFYTASNGHIHQLLYNNSNWADTDLTSQTGGPASDGHQLTAFPTTPNNALHVFYASTGKHVQQLYNVGGSWQNQDLTALTGGPTTGGLWMAGVSIANFQYVYYYGSDRNVHELYYNNATWADEDISPGNVGPNGGTGIAALVIPGTKKIRVYFVGTLNHIYQLASANNKKWISADLSKKTKTTGGNAGNQIVAFATTPNNQIHVYYMVGNDICQLFLPTPATKWQNTDLTTLTHGGSAVPNSGMAGFSLENFQYVFYLAH
jgi:Fungal fucose-specific lectin